MPVKRKLLTVSYCFSNEHTKAYTIWGSFSVQRRSDYFSHCCCDKFKGALLLLWLLLLLLVLELLRLFPIHRSVLFEDSRWKCLESSQVAESQSLDSHLEVLRHEFLLSWICTFAVHPKGMPGYHRNNEPQHIDIDLCENKMRTNLTEKNGPMDMVWPCLTMFDQHAATCHTFMIFHGLLQLGVWNSIQRSCSIAKMQPWHLALRETS